MDAQFGLMKCWLTLGVIVFSNLINISHPREPRDCYSNSNSDDRPDIVAFDSYSGCNIELDISVAHPWNKDILSQAADEDEIVAAKRAVSNNKKYSSKLDVWGNSSNCIPLAFEHFGRWGGLEGKPISP